MARRLFTQEEITYLVEHYSDLGPKVIGQHLGRSMKCLSRKALSLGLQRGVDKSNQARANHWEFKQWSYNLGYIVGVYLGDGNIWQKENQCSYFRHSSIDLDFCQTTSAKIKEVTKYQGSIIWAEQKQQWIYTFCNKDFCNWLVSEFGPANYKHIKLLPSLEANKGMIEGLFDSEGTVQDYSFTIRMSGNLQPIEQICNLLNIRRGSQHKGIRKEVWSPTKDFCGYAISIKEYTRVGLGTYVRRKAKLGLQFKDICWGIQ